MLQGNCWDRSSPAQKLLLGGKRMNGLGGDITEIDSENETVASCCNAIIDKTWGPDWDIQWFSGPIPRHQEA